MPSDVSVELDDHVRKQIVMMCLTDFYRENDPRQLPLVESTFLENSKNITGLFESLLKRYPRVSRDHFDDVMATLRGLDNSSQQQRATKNAQSTMRSKHAQVQELLRDGAALLSEPTPVEFASGLDPGRSTQDTTDRDDDEQSRVSGMSASAYGFGNSRVFGSDAGSDDIGEATSAGHRDDLQMLKQLIEDNRALAEEVAVAEQQVLQKRFEVKYLKLVSPVVQGSNSRQKNVPSALHPLQSDEIFLSSKLMLVSDRDRQFEVPCTASEVAYIQQGPLEAPWSLDDGDHCHVQFQRLDNQSSKAKRGPRDDLALADAEEAPSKVMRTVLAMAMRIWSRNRPHTVIERLPSGDTSTHTSTILWWQWPSPCEGQRGVAPESLLHTNILPDGVDRALLRVDQEINAPQAAARRIDPLLHEEVCHLLAGTPSQHGSESPNKQDTTFWKYFVQQYGALSRMNSSTTATGGGPGH